MTSGSEPAPADVAPKKTGSLPPPRLLSRTDPVFPSGFPRAVFPKDLQNSRKAHAAPKSGCSRRKTNSLYRGTAKAANCCPARWFPALTRGAIELFTGPPMNLPTARSSRTREPFERQGIPGPHVGPGGLRLQRRVRPVLPVQMPRGPAPGNTAIFFIFSPLLHLSPVSGISSFPAEKTRRKGNPGEKKTDKIQP